MNRVTFAVGLLYLEGIVVLTAHAIGAYFVLDGLSEGAFLDRPDRLLTFRGMFIVMFLAGVLAFFGTASRLRQRSFNGWVAAICIFGASLVVAFPLGVVPGVLGLWALVSKPGRQQFGVAVATSEGAG